MRINIRRQVFLKERKYIEKNLNRHINDNFSDFSSSYESDKELLSAYFSLREQF